MPERISFADFNCMSNCVITTSGLFFSIRANASWPVEA
jgi:hypothetical protein